VIATAELMSHRIAKDPNCEEEDHRCRLKVGEDRGKVFGYKEEGEDR